MDIREELIEALKQEIVGPSKHPEYIDNTTGEELLLERVHGCPKSRYGAGLLYPQQTLNSEFETKVDDETDNGGSLEPEDLSDDMFSSHVNSNLSEIENNEADEEPVSLANQYFPSAMGFTARFNVVESNDQIKILISSAYYEAGMGELPVKEVTKDDKISNRFSKGKPLSSKFWLRKPISPEPILLNVNSLFNGETKLYEKTIVKDANGSPWLNLKIFDRSTSIDFAENKRTLTLVLINASSSNSGCLNDSNKLLFQNELRLTTENNRLITPYKENDRPGETDEEKELKLLYREKRIFAIGHGTSVNWSGGINYVNMIETSIIPVFEMPQIAPTNHVELSMLELSDIGNWNKAVESLQKLCQEYGDWIEKLAAYIDSDEELKPYKSAALNNIKKCKNTFERIKRGINILTSSEESSDIVKSFRWMNKAMMWQQQRSKAKQRKWKFIAGKPNPFLEEHESEFCSLEEFHNISQYNCRWRPFQLAFILMNIESLIEKNSNEREIVDLIWFPTGGGKTEAYLGLTALNIFIRRLRGQEKWNWDSFGGTAVLMRYTLRLLTTQQYERAASLICACELIRKNEAHFELGEEEISIGLWVGGTSTPNNNQAAINKYKLLHSDKTAEYPFIILKCPCCGAQFGKIDNGGARFQVKGLTKEDGKHGRVLFKCENKKCEFFNSILPLYVVDEQIYQNPPTLLLATVDKFAMIPWKNEAGKIFGFRKKGEIIIRISPPELIIQDELHLISGPLGTMVGLYETAINALCVDYGKSEKPFIPDECKDYSPPKIVASSATISRAYEQTKCLYGISNKEQLNIFPPQGLSFGNTWFSEEKPIDLKDEAGKQIFPGRKYVGILSPGYPSAQTSVVRAYSSILQRVKELDNQNGIDYYWTLLGYFNSIRELGGASSLVHGDIRERLGQIHTRDLTKRSMRRYINIVEELTGRINSTEIPHVLKKLENNFEPGKHKAMDICLATNMIATGVDVSRLGLMFIHGQPKTTAEYIQASSRVGREVPNGPGVIFTLYSPNKPRDKSHYEQFHSYHGRVYSNVEPTSITPFSIRARERGLHAVFIAMMRYFSSGNLRNSPLIIDEDEFDKLSLPVKRIILDRCKTVAPEELDNTEKLLGARIRFWKRGFQEYGDAGNYGILKNGTKPLMCAISNEAPIDIEKHSLLTQTSMRGVDTESVVFVYAGEDDDE